eukprot:SAG31_NODE_3280_length_4470_cov_7.297644_6_plen_77_part_00
MLVAHADCCSAPPVRKDALINIITPAHDARSKSKPAGQTRIQAFSHSPTRAIEQGAYRRYLLVLNLVRASYLRCTY